MFEWHAEPALASEQEAADALGTPVERDLNKDLEDAVRLERNIAALTGRAPVRDIETAARAADAGHAARRRSGTIARIVALAASLALVAGAAWEYRTEVVRAAPRMAALYELAGEPVNVRGMDFSGVTVEREFEDGLPVLAVTGEIVNVSERFLEIPRLRFGLRNGSAQEIYHWTMAVSAERLAPDERTRFVTRLAAPPQEARDVVVRFHDVGARSASIAD